MEERKDDGSKKRKNPHSPHLLTFLIMSLAAKSDTDKRSLKWKLLVKFVAEWCKLVYAYLSGHEWKVISWELLRTVWPSNCCEIITACQSYKNKMKAIKFNLHFKTGRERDTDESQCFSSFY